MSGAAGMTASAAKVLYKTLLKRPRQLMDLAKKMPVSNNHPFTHIDGRVAAVHPEMEFFVCSPNMDFIPFPHLGSHVVVFSCDDLRFGHLDPTQWPQDWSSDISHVACIPRIQQDGVLRGLWLTPTIDFDFEVDPTLGQGLGRMRKEFFIVVSDSVQATKDASARVLDPKKIPLSDQLGLHINHFLHVLRTRGLSYRRTLLLLRCLQRLSLELQGLANYHRVVVPRWNSNETSVPQVEASWLGAFTDDPVTMARLYRVGIPVWTVWYITEAVRTRCFSVVEFEWPQNTLELAEAREHNLRRAVYDGVYGDKVYRTIREWTFERASGLASARMVAVIPSRPTGALPMASSVSRVARPGRQEKKQPGKRRTFKQVYHKYLPTPVKTWVHGLEQVEDNDALCVDPKSPLVFCLPRPELFVSAESDSKLKSIFVNWLRLRGVILSFIHDPNRSNPSDWCQISHQAWRLLVHNGTLDIVKPKEGSKETRFADEVVALVQAIRCDEQGLGGVPLSVMPTWHGTPFDWKPEDPSHDAVCREILWECAMTGFVLDFLVLDSRLAFWSDGEKSHSVALRQCFRTADERMLVDIDLGMANIGLADPDWVMRAPYVLALKVVVRHWALQEPHASLPAEITANISADGYTEGELLALEEALAKAIIRIFHVEFRRAPVLLPTLPSPGADPAHVTFQPPDVPRTYAPTGSSGRWWPSTLLRDLDKSFLWN